MENRKKKILAISFIAILTLTTGCGITITRNQYYGYTNQQEKSPTKKETNNHYQTDTLNNTKNGENS